jgi:hypothetical protein
LRILFSLAPRERQLRIKELYQNEGSLKEFAGQIKGTLEDISEHVESEQDQFVIANTKYQRAKFHFLKTIDKRAYYDGNLGIRYTISENGELTNFDLPTLSSPSPVFDMKGTFCGLIIKPSPTNPEVKWSFSPEQQKNITWIPKEDIRSSKDGV